MGNLYGLILYGLSYNITNSITGRLHEPTQNLNNKMLSYRRETALQGAL